MTSVGPRVGQTVQCSPGPITVPTLVVERGRVIIRPLFTAPGMQEPDMSIYSDVQLMDDIDSTVHTECFPPPLNDAVAQALEKSDWHALHVGDGMTAAAVLAPGNRPFAVGTPDKMVDINHFHFFTGHLGENLLRATARQHGIILTGVLQSCAGCVKAKGCARRGTAEDDIARGEAQGQCILIGPAPTRRPWGARLSDHVLGQRLEVDSAIRDEEEIRDDRVRQDVHRRHEPHGAAAMFPHGQQRRVHRSQLRRLLRLRRDTP